MDSASRSTMAASLTRHLNLNHLRIFAAVYRSTSMTEAAKDLALTQSGVSQHIKSLEEEIGIRLFDRIKQRLVPTSGAHALYDQCIKSLNELENALSSIKGNPQKLQGRVNLGMPIEFGNNLILPLLNRLSELHPDLSFNITLGYTSHMLQMLLDGKIDFAFIDEIQTDQRMESIRVYEEILDLVISESLLEQYGPINNTKKFFESLPYVALQEGETRPAHVV